jgi:methyl-accepting chemotaxis protein
VAEEVKNLAEDSREAAERIAKMIREVQNDTAKAVEAMKRSTSETSEGMLQVGLTGTAFKNMLEITTQFGVSMNELALRMQTQKDDTARATRAVGSIASISEETASASEESAASTQELTASMQDLTARAQALAEMASNMQLSVSQFKIEEQETEKSAEKTREKVSGPGSNGRTDAKIPEKVKEALDRRDIGTAKKGTA